MGSDILFHAITHANVHDVIALLHDNEVDVNCTNINGQTPLHVSLFIPLLCCIGTIILFKIAELKDVTNYTYFMFVVKKYAV